jgi:ABC-type antimicrobial peptide transport system permease subunit
MGLFAVVSYLVSQRTQEIGVRLALGGSGGAVAMLVVRDAVRMTAIGAGLGILIALVGAPAFQPMLFQTSSRDPMVMIAVTMLLLSVAAAAAAVPARRASGVNPMLALRNQ